MRYGAVIIAAGMSARMENLKQLMNIGDASIAERVIMNFQSAGVRDIVMVTGCNAAQLEKSLRDLDITFVRNENYETTYMFDSAKLGFEKLADMKPGCNRVFFCPVGVPFFTDRTVTEEMSVMDGDPDSKVVVPRRGGRDGHPILIDCSALPDILSHNGDRGMKGAFEALPAGSVLRMTVSDDGAFTGADTTDEYRELMDKHNEHILHPVIKLSFASTKPFFGPGSVSLLREIDRCGNVRDACEKCGFSYSKGWTILKKCEEKFGYRIVERQVGGQNGGSARVTDKGRDLLAVYEKLTQEIEQTAEIRFRELMSEYQLAGEPEKKA